MVPLFGVALAALALGEPLTIGKSAPPLALGAFLKGEPVKALAKGTVYVVEFSGTQCVPCIKAIPHLTALQKKHASVVFLSLYGEPEADVRKFLTKRGDGVGFRVALRDAAVWAAWMRAANLDGIPAAFVVGKDGRIAWIGHPVDLADPLQKILDGTFDPRLDRMQLLFKQADVRAFESNYKQIDPSNKTRSRIYSLLHERRWTEAISEAEKAIKAIPEHEAEYRDFILQALASNPETVEKAIPYAAELSAARRWAWGDLKSHDVSPDASLAFTLVQAHRANPDPTLLDAATLLMKRAESYLAESKKEGGELVEQKLTVGRVAVYLSEAKKDFADAAKRQRAYLELLRKQAFNPKGRGERDVWEGNHRRQVEQAEKMLAEYVAAGAKKDK